MDYELDTATVGDIVAADFRAAAIFDRFSIDFCCGGRQSLDEACDRARVDRARVVDSLRALPAHAGAAENTSTWTVDALIDRIVGAHHAYVRESLPTIAQHLAKLVAVHGERHPELAAVGEAFDAVSRELTQHMMKEEQILFPYIRGLARFSSERRARTASPFGSVENPIRMMEQEHRDAAHGLETIRTLTRDYAVPGDGCRTYAVTLQELAEFEQDLHRHVHLENNVLFPRAVALERAGALS